VVAAGYTEQETIFKFLFIFFDLTSHDEDLMSRIGCIVRTLARVVFEQELDQSTQRFNVRIRLQNKRDQDIKTVQCPGLFKSIVQLQKKVKHNAAFRTVEKNAGLDVVKQQIISNVREMPLYREKSRKIKVMQPCLSAAGIQGRDSPMFKNYS
jgi:hypothetical protein